MTRKQRVALFFTWAFVVVGTLAIGAGLIEIMTKHDYGGFVAIAIWVVAVGVAVKSLADWPPDSK